MSERKAGVEESVRQFLIDQARLDHEEELLETDSLLERGVLDSTVMVTLVAFIEETYGFQVEDEELMPENFDSLVSIAAYVARKQVVPR